MEPSDQLLFTYGTLQHAEVQLDTFGRLVAGEPDALPGYTIDYVEIEEGYYKPVITEVYEKPGKADIIFFTLTLGF